MKNLTKVIVIYALLVMLWSGFSLLLGRNGGNAPLLIFIISSILLASSTYLLKITK